MNLVKEYKGLKIFVSNRGEFYCDVNTNSNDYKKKSFVSTKLQSIEKAIDEFNGQEIDGNRYYDIAVYNTTITPLKIVKCVGNRFFLMMEQILLIIQENLFILKVLMKNKSFKI